MDTSIAGRSASLLAAATLLGGLVTVASSAMAGRTLSPPPAETGIWLNDSGEGAIEVYVCQDRADRLCGRLIWVKDPISTIDGKPKRDRYNPKAEMQNRPICGLPILGNLGVDPDGGFDGGWIYDPKVGKSYSSAIKLKSPDRLEVRGYVGVKFLGKSFIWTRAGGDQPRCDGAPPPAN